MLPTTLRLRTSTNMLQQLHNEKLPSWQYLLQRFGSRQCSSSNKPAIQPKAPEISENQRIRKDLDASHVPTELHRRILVHFKYYPDLESVPKRVPLSLMGKALSQARIKVSISMMVTALVLCFLTAWYGKTHQHEMSLVEVNLRRHEAYKMGNTGQGGRMALVMYDKNEGAEEKKE